MNVSAKKRNAFKAYRPGETQVPVTCITPLDGFYIHTYYDVCPFSPSGRFVAVTRLPFQDHKPCLGETAQVCIIDLEEETLDTVYTNQGWDVDTV